VHLDALLALMSLRRCHNRDRINVGAGLIAHGDPGPEARAGRRATQTRKARAFGARPVRPTR
jgi:hypothetical protein